MLNLNTADQRLLRVVKESYKIRNRSIEWGVVNDAQGLLKQEGKTIGRIKGDEHEVPLYDWMKENHINKKDFRAFDFIHNHKNKKYKYSNHDMFFNRNFLPRTSSLSTQDYFIHIDPSGVKDIFKRTKFKRLANLYNKLDYKHHKHEEESWMWDKMNKFLAENAEKHFCKFSIYKWEEAPFIGKLIKSRGKKPEIL